MENMAVKFDCMRFTSDGWADAPVYVPAEMELTIFVNKQELVTILCTPGDLNYLVLGFLHGEGIISNLDDIASMRLCADEALADVRLKNPDFRTPARRTLTSGCGGGTIFKAQGEKVDSPLVVSPADVLSLMEQLLEQMELYRLSGGVHTSALAETDKLLVIAEDIGRHNTLDKIQGECLVRGIATRDRLLLTTGRISSEMLFKAAKMQIPVIVSRHSPTGNAVTLARELGITLVGHARAGRFVVYSHPERLGRPDG